MIQPVTAALPHVTPTGTAIGSALFLVILAAVATTAITAVRRTGKHRKEPRRPH